MPGFCAYRAESGNLLSENQKMHFIDVLVARSLPFIPRAIVKRLSTRYLAGSTLGEALQVIQNLNRAGFGVTLDVLGESATSAAEADAMNAAYATAIAAIAANNLDAELSIKPSALGLLNDEAQCEARIRQILAQATQVAKTATLDMEDLQCTQKELDLLSRLQPDYPDLGIAIQAYLQRSYADINQLMATRSRLRICKGIYQEDPQFLVAEASRDRSAINPHFLAHVKRCFAEGLFVSVATHDEALIEAVVALAKQHHVAPDAFEFQMLLGVCEPLRDRVRALGFAVRVYVPYGADWYGYSTRRLQENPRIAGYILRALIKR